MLSIAITGSFASGKSFVLSLMKDNGFKTFSCDVCVNNLYNNEIFQDKILELLPNLKKFDKKELAELIYSDNSIRKKIENLIHPIILKDIENFKQENIVQKFIFVEVPLLFEVGWEKHFDFTITTYCSESKRLEHAKLKSNFSQKMYDRLNQIQISQDEKIRRANFVINTSAKMVMLKTQIITILEKLQ